MNKQFNYRNQMLLAVYELFTQNPLVWQNIPILVILVNELKQRLDTIKETARIAGVKLTGVVGNKNSTMDELNTFMFEIISALKTYANREHDGEMLAMIDFAESHLDNIRQGDTLTLAEYVVSLLDKDATTFVDYGITADDAKKLKTLTTDFSKQLPAVGVSQAERKSANGKLADLFADANLFLDKQLDNMVKSLRSKSPDFYSAYDNARDVTIYGIRHEKKDESGDTGSTNNQQPSA